VKPLVKQKKKSSVFILEDPKRNPYTASVMSYSDEAYTFIPIVFCKKLFT
jgi:hypothetical protein